MTYSCIALFYWAFTTLSTVGFGDYHPKSDSERLMCSVVFVAGIGIFGKVLENFGNILISIVELEADFEN